MSNADATDLDAWKALMLVQRRILGRVDQALKDQELPSAAWIQVLWHLEAAGADGLRPVVLQDALGLAQYTVSRLSSRIAAEGYAERRAIDGDKRAQVIALTPKGAAMLRRAWPIYRAAVLSELSLKLDRSEVQTLVQILDKLA